MIQLIILPEMKLFILLPSCSISQKQDAHPPEMQRELNPFHSRSFPNMLYYIR